MSAAATMAVSSRAGTVDVAVVFARWLLGALFVSMGLSKALHPVEFLKLARQYDVLHHYLLLNVVTSTLPWLEVFCGLLLLLGVAVRGAVGLLLVMLLSFSVAVLFRALAIRESGGIPLCAIKFDCGCGTGELPVCAKLGGNLVLMALSSLLLFRSSHRLCLRDSVFKTASSSDPD